MHAVCGLPIVLALGARELDLQDRKQLEARRLVLEPNQTRVEVDFGRERRDADEGGGADDHQWGDGLVEEAGVDVRGLLEYNDVAASALRCADLWKDVSTLNLHGSTHTNYK